MGLASRLPARFGIATEGHRRFVGDQWDELGQLQFHFMVREGLQPSDSFLDIGCGALRGGVHFIHYLDAENYLGLEKERRLIEIAIRDELGRELYELKRPELVVSDSFAFQRFSKQPVMSLAQSLFTALNEHDIGLCLQNLREFVEKGHAFYATFHEGPPERNRRRSHALAMFTYSQDAMRRFGREHGWETSFIGDWKHPRKQQMMRYIAA